MDDTLTLPSLLILTVTTFGTAILVAWSLRSRD